MAEETRRKEYGEKTVSQLKQLLRERDLLVKGNKPDLIERLLEYEAYCDSIKAKAPKKAVAPEAVEPAEPEVAEVAEPEVTEAVEPEVEPEAKVTKAVKPKTCATRGCSNEATPGHKHCGECHAEWQFGQDFPGVERKLEGAQKAFGRFNDYAPAKVLFEEAKDYFIDGNFEAALAALKEASDEVDVITAQGTLKYARRLTADAEEYGVSVDEEIAKLIDQVETALFKPGGPKPWQAAKNAGKLRDLLRPLVGEIREAKDRRKRAEFVGGAPVGKIIPQGTREALVQMGQEQGRQRHQSGEKGHDRRKRDRSKRPPRTDKRGRGLQDEIEAGLGRTEEGRE